MILICMNTEIWKDVCGYEGLYQISSFGNVRRTTEKYKRMRTMKFMKSKRGYLRIMLWKDGIRKPYAVHRLVAIAFISNDCPEKIFVHHKNHKRDDNRVENLEWVTAKMNSDYNPSVSDVINHTLKEVFYIMKIKKPSSITCSVIMDSLYRDM